MARSGKLWVLLLLSASGHGHGLALVGQNLGEQNLDWSNDEIGRVVALNNGEVVSLGGKKCMEGSRLFFDVDDRDAFDIDEPVHVGVEFYLRATDSKIILKYEQNGKAESARAAEVPAYSSGSHVKRMVFLLDRARFANRGWFGTDFSIELDVADAHKYPSKKMTICDIAVNRSYATRRPVSYGQIALQTFDETGCHLAA